MKSLTATLAVLILLVLTSVTSAMFMRPEPVPVDRIVGNAEAYVDAHPEEALGYYVLGRAHYLAWTLKSNTIPSWPTNQDAAERVQSIPGDHMISRDNYAFFQLQEEAKSRTLRDLGVESERELTPEQQQTFWQKLQKTQETLQKEGWKPEPVDAETLDYHAEEGIKKHRKAIELDPKNGLYRIGLASLLEEYAQRGSERSITAELHPAAEGVEVPASDWLQTAAEQYAKAYELSAEKDTGRGHMPLHGLQELVSFNAMQGYQRIAKVLPPEWVDTELVEEMAETKKKLDNLEPGPVTPIVLSLNPEANKLEQLLAPAGAEPVRFDLDGDGVAELRPWVKPDTAFLVWDPHRTGKITSGRQLFGSVSFWLLPGDGYRAMDLLDDNRDGELSMSELAGLALWYDRNTNGISEPGEVVPIEDTSIASLSTTAAGVDAGSPMSEQGLRMSDGSTRPTWDWIAPAAK